MAVAKNQLWYREPWPWILILLPLSAVVASFITIWLAVVSEDGLVADDYYKQGIAINQTLHRDQAAQAMRLGAILSIGADGQTLTVKLTGKLVVRPDTLRLSIVHPTQSGRDQYLTLPVNAAGIYSATLPSLAGSVRWRMVLEEPLGVWRLSGHWQTGKQTINLGVK